MIEHRWRIASWVHKAARILALGALALAVQAGSSLGQPKPYQHPGGDVLWNILSKQCVAPFLAGGGVGPCQLVSGAGRPGGYVLLKSREGIGQYLLMPADKVTGIEDSALLGPAPTNYFARAWYARGFVEALIRRPLEADEVSVAVNSGEGRSQDQLHLHIDCLRTDVRGALASLPVDGAPFRTTIQLLGHPYRVARIAAAQLDAADPFMLLASAIPGARSEMGEWTLVLVGAPPSAGGEREFLLLAGRANPSIRFDASGEELQDHTCGLLPSGATN